MKEVSSFFEEQQADQQQQEEEAEQQLEYEAFLSNLHEAEELSIELTEHCSPHEALQAVFRLHLSSKSNEGLQSDSQRTRVLTLERKGIRNPTSAWPHYSFLVDPFVSNFILGDLLRAEKCAPESTTPSSTVTTAITVSTLRTGGCQKLQRLALHGFGRQVPSFYPKLISTLADKSPGLKSLSIRDWNDFCSSQLPGDASRRLFSRLRQFHVDCFCADTLTPDPASLGSALSCMSQLQGLHIQSNGRVNPTFWRFMARAITHLQDLRQLRWAAHTHTTATLAATALPPHDSMSSLCAAIGSRPLMQSLDLSWEGRQLQPRELRVLLNQLSTAASIKSLALHHINLECQQALGEFLQNHDNHPLSLNHLKVSLHDEIGSTSTSVPILEGILRNPSIASLRLCNVAELDNDASKTLQMVCLYNTTLTHLAVETLAVIDAGCLQDIFLGLSHNATLVSVSIRSNAAPTVLDHYTSASLQDVLEQNATLQRLTLNVQVPEGDDCALMVAQGICGENSAFSSLTALHGVEFVDSGGHGAATAAFASGGESDEHADAATLVVQALHHNFVLTEMTPCASPKQRHLLLLNKLGRRYWNDPNFPAALLLPHILEKSSSVGAGGGLDQAYSILQTCLSYAR